MSSGAERHSNVTVMSYPHGLLIYHISYSFSFQFVLGLRNNESDVQIWNKILVVFVELLFQAKEDQDALWDTLKVNTVVCVCKFKAFAIWHPLALYQFTGYDVTFPCAIIQGEPSYRGYNCPTNTTKHIKLCRYNSTGPRAASFTIIHQLTFSESREMIEIIRRAPSFAPCFVVRPELLRKGQKHVSQTLTLCFLSLSPQCYQMKHIGYKISLKKTTRFLGFMG